jgi:AcrR family transcriptional regulator
MADMAPADQVRTRTGGRSAAAREKVLAALSEALAAGDPDALSIDDLARRSGVHRTTIYRRWMSTSGAIADLLTEITPLEVPLPDTGDLRRDLTATAERVWRTITSPAASAIVRRIAGSTNPELAQAAQDYWSRMLGNAAAIVRQAQQRGQAASDVDPEAAIETLLAPLYLRLLITREPVGTAVITDLVDRAIRLLRPA